MPDLERQDYAGEPGAAALRHLCTVRDMLGQGSGVSAIAKALGISVGSVHGMLKAPVEVA